MSRDNHEQFISKDEDSVFTTLCEDVFTLVYTQLDLVDDFLRSRDIEKSEDGSRLVFSSVLSIIQNLHQLQLVHRDRFLGDLKSSCAAANDFMRMIECFDEFMEAVFIKYPFLHKSSCCHESKRESDFMAILLEQEASDLVALYGNDAVYSVERSSIFLMRAIWNSSIPNELFSYQWEDEFVFNEVALAIIKTSEDFLCDCHNFLSCSFLYKKIVVALICSLVNFYLQCLLEKAERLRRFRFRIGQKETRFRSSRRVVMRMMYDIELFRAYFFNLIEQLPQLEKLVDEELSKLVVFHECLRAAAENKSIEEVVELFLVLHKRTGANVEITKLIMQDIWLLVARIRGQRKKNAAISSLHDELTLLSEGLHQTRRQTIVTDPRHRLPCLRIEEMLYQNYESRIMRNDCQSFLCQYPTEFHNLMLQKSTQIKFLFETPAFCNSISSKCEVSEFFSSELFHFFDGCDCTNFFPNFNHSNMPTSLTPRISSRVKFSKCEKEKRKKCHEEKLKYLKAKMYSKLKLHNIHFITKLTTNDLERRLAEINEFNIYGRH
jgi:hypothetical protein